MGRFENDTDQIYKRLQEVTDGCKPPHECWKLTLDPLQEQPEALTASSPLFSPLGKSAGFRKSQTRSEQRADDAVSPVRWQLC